jgi:hypothetical protein
VLNDSPVPTWSHTNSVMAHRESQQQQHQIQQHQLQQQQQQQQQQQRDSEVQFDQRNISKKQDIFSQAVASAEIEEFASDTGKIREKEKLQHLSVQLVNYGNTSKSRPSKTIL